MPCGGWPSEAAAAGISSAALVPFLPGCRRRISRSWSRRASNWARECPERPICSDGRSQLNGTLAVRDLDSRNGTFANGQKVAEAVLLPGDELLLGMTRLNVAYKRRASGLVPVAGGRLPADR